MNPIARNRLIYLLGFLLLTFLISFALLKSIYAPTHPQPPVSVNNQPSPAPTTRTLTGTLKLGQELPDEICEPGLYLEALPGKVLNKYGKTALLLRAPGDKTTGNPMFTDNTYLNQTVNISGIYPAQQEFCAALLCDCEDYILVHDIQPQ
jgi:hypothetical protein